MDGLEILVAGRFQLGPPGLSEAGRPGCLHAVYWRRRTMQDFNSLFSVAIGLYAGSFFKLSRASSCPAAPAHQVNNENDNRHYQQQVDQAPSHVQAEAQQP